MRQLFFLINLDVYRLIKVLDFFRKYDIIQLPNERKGDSKNELQ